MMMPANFSAVSENEMTYVMGGSVADYLAPAMGAAQWQNFHKNLITIVGNKYVQGFLGYRRSEVRLGRSGRCERRSERCWQPGCYLQPGLRHR